MKSLRIIKRLGDIEKMCKKRLVNMVYMRSKRFMDILISLTGLIILSPVFVILIIAIKLDSEGPVFFKQERIGIHKTHFNILKFRTMRIDTPQNVPTHLLDNPDRWITDAGQFLRKTSLDELPQIVNILKGEMSIVGPRPVVGSEYDLIEERDKYGANDIPVGLTGWAQINGRDELTVEEKAKLDGEYVKRRGFVFDMTCFFRTFPVILKREGVVEGRTCSITRLAKEKKDTKQSTQQSSE